MKIINMEQPKDRSIKFGEPIEKNLTKTRFGIDVARYIATALGCQRALKKMPGDKSLIQNIASARANFYKELENFKRKYPRLPATIIDQLPALQELEEEDWTKEETAEKLEAIRQNIFPANPIRE